MEISVDKLEHLFTHHAPKPCDIQAYKEIREAGLAFAKIIDKHTPYDCNEYHNAIESTRNAVMWANAGIACYLD